MSFSLSLVNKVILVILVSLIGLLIFTLYRPLPINETTMIEIEKGYGLNQLIDRLSEQGLVNRPLILKGYVKVFKRSDDIKAGEYLISKTNNALQLIQKVSEGSVYYHQIRLREGSTINELIDLFKNNTVLKKDENFDDKNKIRSDLGLEINSLEGLFHPDTYNYIKGDSYLDILKRSNLKHQKILNQLWSQRNINLPFKNSYEALILASIIEKEGTEKKQIAGVFVRRLKLRMKLQSDPTIIFALGDEYDGDIKSSHIKMKHPYNTYHIKGLPPGPIGLVSESSIQAALNPEEGNSLFFVSKGDGTHYFSDTLEEHNQAVQRFQLNK
ncbi:MAG TPA: endolytic transglycosylase MltG [Gammaproteobacteria bacterium]|nr:endolytic transglycosylase MltG [Gammaproteobacteria bacterium]